MKRRRCLIPADGFYEWKEEGRNRRPFVVRRKGGGPIAFAGLWETWMGPNGEEMETASIVTTSANRMLAPLHDRMPVIVPPADFAGWLDPARQDPKQIVHFLRPYAAEETAYYPVSTLVNNPRVEDARCREAVPM